MPSALLDGIATRYEVAGSGPPLLMFSPGGFDARIEKWSDLGIYAKTRMLDHLSRHYRCILFDRRECGQSGGRVERITWADYARQGKALLDHLGIESAHLMGGCMGCSPVAAFATLYPQSVRSMVLYWPVGGARYRIQAHQRFADHLRYVDSHGLAGVVALVKESGLPFGADPRGGPWASVIKHDGDFAAHYAGLDVEPYKSIAGAMARGLFDRDTAPGAEAEDLLTCAIPALVVPGADASHATSAARYLAECLPKSDYWNMDVEGQSETATAARLLGFLDTH